MVRILRLNNCINLAFFLNDFISSLERDGHFINFDGFFQNIGEAFQIIALRLSIITEAISLLEEIEYVSIQ